MRRGDICGKLCGVETLACGHVAYPGARRLCPHLVEPGASLTHQRLLTGVGVLFDCCCPRCGSGFETAGTRPDLLEVCEGCVARVEDSASYVGWLGEPGIAERPEAFDPTITTTPLPWRPLDVAAVADLPDRWVLLDNHRLAVFSTGSNRVDRCWSIQLPDERPPTYGQPHQPSVHPSPDGRFAAVATNYGSHGFVLDLTTGAEVMRLHRQDYKPDVTPFPIAWTTHGDRWVLIHATDWNRLDVTDPVTGATLSAREFPADPTSGRKARSLDYFHGELYVSPGRRWIADDGWVWQPDGIPVVWGLAEWAANPYESDDGPSLRQMCWRGSYWNAPMCWIDDDRLAIYGIGDDYLLPGVRVFDPDSGDELATFAGPDGPLHSDGHRLYASTERGLEIWDPDTGERTGTIAGFQPTRHHRGAGELVEIVEDAMRRWRIPAWPSGRDSRTVR